MFVNNLLNVAVFDHWAPPYYVQVAFALSSSYLRTNLFISNANTYELFVYIMATI